MRRERLTVPNLTDLDRQAMTEIKDLLTVLDKWMEGAEGDYDSLVIEAYRKLSPYTRGLILELGS